MKSAKHYNWLQIVEGCSVASCIAGSIVSVVYQQLAYASAPLAVALSLNLINRSRFLSQMRQQTRSAMVDVHRSVESLDQKVQALPTKTTDDSINKSLFQLQRTIETLTQQFNTRPETQEVEQLSKVIAQLANHLNILSLRFDSLPTPQEIDPSKIKSGITNLSNQLNALVKQVNAKAEVEAIEKLDESVQEIQQKTKAQIQGLFANLQAFDLNRTNSNTAINSNIARLQSQINQFNQQIQDLPPPFDPSPLEQRYTILLTQYNRLLQFVQGEIAKTRQSIASVQDSTATAVVEARSSFLAEIESLRARLDALPTPTDLTPVEEVIALLEALRTAQNHLILVCPWPTDAGFDRDVIQLCNALLARGTQLEIGWGHLKDIKEGKLGKGFFYSALTELQNLRNRYRSSCKLKLLGTHEKFLVCDHSWAMLGSHNFLTSGNKSAEREVGLQTNDPRIITDLISRFDNAKNLEEEG